MVGRPRTRFWSGTRAVLADRAGEEEENVWPDPAEAEPEPDEVLAKARNMGAGVTRQGRACGASGEAGSAAVCFRGCTWVTVEESGKRWKWRWKESGKKWKWAGEREGEREVVRGGWWGGALWTPLCADGGGG